jgi:hypothetical protein
MIVKAVILHFEESESLPDVLLKDDLINRL